MAKWIAEFDLEDGDTMPEHMELEYKGAKIDFHCRPMGINALPSAQPEREKGKWIVYYECPKCGEITKDFTEYCPFCNADMRGKEDE